MQIGRTIVQDYSFKKTGIVFNYQVLENKQKAVVWRIVYNEPTTYYTIDVLFVPDSILFYFFRNTN